MGVVISRLWTEKANPSQESQKAMEAQLTVIQATVAAQSQAHSEMMAMVQAQLAAMRTEAAAQSQAHSEMVAMVQTANEARLLAEAAAHTASEEVKQKAAEVEEERKRTLAIQEQAKKDVEAATEYAKKIEEAANEEKMKAIAAQEAANTSKKEAEIATEAANEERMKAIAAQEAAYMLEKEAEKEANTALAIQERVKSDVKAAAEQVKKLEEAVIEEKMKATVALEVASTLRKEAEEEVRKANAAREEVKCKLKEAGEEVKKVNAAKEKAERKLKGGMQPVVTPTPEEFSATRKRIQYQENFFHCAIAGEVGVGKSSLINAFRGLRDGDIGSAATDITEWTLMFGRYANANPQIPYVWYEIPDAGTLRVPDWHYFNTQGLYVFNCVIVMFDDRLTMTDIAILTNCRRFNIPTRIVRSRADQHIRNIISCNMGHDDEDNEDQKEKLYPVAQQQFIEETRRIVKDDLDNANLPDQKVYIVSNEAMLGVAKEGRPKGMIDEIELWDDLFLSRQKLRVPCQIM